MHTLLLLLLLVRALARREVSPGVRLRSAPLSLSLSLSLCRAAQLLTDREMRGGDAGWGHKQGEAEEEKAEREPSP